IQHKNKYNIKKPTFKIRESVFPCKSTSFVSNVSWRSKSHFHIWESHSYDVKDPDIIYMWYFIKFWPYI
uniref:Uncharacterized protein n=1 Tax=Phasianus colchicus TaxID=9054 RepID=A0A669P0Z5_PHACC